MTAPRSFVPPPIWDDATLDADRWRPKADFIAERTRELMEGNVRYRRVFTENLTSVQVLFAATNDLLDFASGAALASNPALMRAARYLGGPPVSADDLDTLAQARVASRRRLPTDLAQKAAGIIQMALDAERFPWLFEAPPRPPTTEERHTAVHWTAGLMTAQQVQTSRRSESSKRQEEAVRQLLTTLGFKPLHLRRIDASGDLVPGAFSSESIVVGSKCDIPVRLHDGRLLLIECKVSNSDLNSIKRLNRESEGRRGGGQPRLVSGRLPQRSWPVSSSSTTFKTPRQLTK